MILLISDQSLFRIQRQGTLFMGDGAMTTFQSR